MTKLQQEVMIMIKEYHNQTGLTPTYNEIKEYCGLSAVSHAHKIVMALAKNNYLNLDTHGVRKIRLQDVKSDGQNE
tara:strand:+ start:454 stop:681 length:228 start_codon:yes stop_codon:yes gene_type:complete